MLDFIFNFLSKFYQKPEEDYPDYSVIDEETGNVNKKVVDISVCYALKAETERKLGNLENALKNINQAININPNCDMYFFTMALIYRDMDNTDKYFESLEIATKLNPEYQKYKNIIEGID